MDLLGSILKSMDAPPTTEVDKKAKGLSISLNCLSRFKGITSDRDILQLNLCRPRSVPFLLSRSRLQLICY